MSTVGVFGLGLIGGSFVKAYHAAGWTVLAHNRSRSTLDFAMLSGDVDGELTKENISDCDLVLLTIFPEAAIDWRNAAGEVAPYWTWLFNLIGADLPSGSGTLPASLLASPQLQILASGPGVIWRP